MTTHADLLADVEKARNDHDFACPDPGEGLCCGTFLDRAAHCDDLAALLATHKPVGCPECSFRYDSCECGDDWPGCPTVGIVRDRLTAWGQL